MTQKFTHSLAAMEAEAEGGREGGKRRRGRREAASAWLGEAAAVLWEGERENLHLLPLLTPHYMDQRKLKHKQNLCSKEKRTT
ncbi:hypothetical protein Droror1_Dr00016365 [Drosera rotundifolia]